MVAASTALGACSLTRSASTGPSRTAAPSGPLNGLVLRNATVLTMMRG
ncbi:MAG: hypothetical protein H0V96_01815 [Acidimicrobiia bacterium]|nr:hypothetical protein [Acidimicrobiia bacterium]